MHSPWFYLFFAGYLLLCAYIGWRGMLALPRHRALRACWVVLIAFLSLGFVGGVLLRAYSPTLMGVDIGHLLYETGVVWIVSTPYWTVAAVFWHALALINRRRRIFPAWIAANYARAKFAALAGTIVVVAGIFVAGFFRFANPDTTVLDIKIAKRAEIPAASRADSTTAASSLRIVVASDLHLGDTIGRERLRKYVERINALKPDIILLPGDIVDRGVASLDAQNIGPELAKLRAPLGVHAVLGNHEGYAQAERCTAFLTKWGVRVLRDEVIELAGGAFYLAGRHDYSFRNRKSLERLLAGVDRARPIILMDHQPHDFAEAEAAGVDLQFSGHTHGGQIWPITWIVRLIYENAHGHSRKNNLQVYVTSGLGLWGLPARIGSSSEIVDARVEFGPPAAGN